MRRGGWSKEELAVLLVLGRAGATRYDIRAALEAAGWYRTCDACGSRMVESGLPYRSRRLASWTRAHQTAACAALREQASAAHLPAALAALGIAAAPAPATAPPPPLALPSLDPEDVHARLAARVIAAVFPVAAGCAGCASATAPAAAGVTGNLVLVLLGIIVLVLLGLAAFVYWYTDGGKWREDY